MNTLFAKILVQKNILIVGESILWLSDPKADKVPKEKLIENLKTQKNDLEEIQQAMAEMNDELRIQRQNLFSKDMQIHKLETDYQKLKADHEDLLRLI